jgi:hypothetical protein
MDVVEPDEDDPLHGDAAYVRLLISDDGSTLWPDYDNHLDSTPDSRIAAIDALVDGLGRLRERLDALR